MIIHTVKHMTSQCTFYLQGTSWLYPKNKYNALRIFPRLPRLYYDIDFCICHHTVTLKCIAELIAIVLYLTSLSKASVALRLQKDHDKKIAIYYY